MFEDVFVVNWFKPHVASVRVEFEYDDVEYDDLVGRCWLHLCHYTLCYTDWQDAVLGELALARAPLHRISRVFSDKRQNL